MHSANTTNEQQNQPELLTNDSTDFLSPGDGFRAAHYESIDTVRIYIQQTIRGESVALVSVWEKKKDQIVG